MRLKIFSICILFSLNSLAQLIPQKFEENLLKGKVKQIDEFMMRFNMSESWEGGRMTEVKDTLFQKKYLATLFDASLFRDKHGDLAPMPSEFIDHVVDNGYKLHFEDSTWVAEVKAEARFMGGDESLTIYLRTQRCGPCEYKWVISNVSGRIFNFPPYEGKLPLISPAEHEIGFAGLLTMKPSPANVLNYIDGKAGIDKLSVFAFLLSHGLMTLEAVGNVRFHFFTIPGYSFVVERVEKKNSYNTGWLITQINKL